MTFRLPRRLQPLAAGLKVALTALLTHLAEGLTELATWLTAQTSDRDREAAQLLQTRLLARFGQVWARWEAGLNQGRSRLPGRWLQRLSPPQLTGILAGISVVLLLWLSSLSSAALAPKPTTQPTLTARATPRPTPRPTPLKPFRPTPSPAASPAVNQTASPAVNQTVSPAVNQTVSPTANPATVTPTVPPQPTQPITGSPVTSLPVTASPVTTSPVAANPPAASPVTANPVIASPVIASPVIANPMPANPVTANPMPANPVTAKPVTANPVTANPVVANPSATNLITANPVAAGVLGAEQVLSPGLGASAVSVAVPALGSALNNASDPNTAPANLSVTSTPVHPAPNPAPINPGVLNPLPIPALVAPPSPVATRSSSPMPPVLSASPSPRATVAPTLAPAQLSAQLPILAPAPPQPTTPEQRLLGSLESNAIALANRYADNLVLNVRADLASNTLTLQLSPTWYSLSPARQDTLAQELWSRSHPFEFRQLILTDSDGYAIARSPVVGDTMVILRRR